jgi:excisionase family DNA binding protein
VTGASTSQHQTTPPLLLTIPEAARILAIGRSTLYELIGRGELPTVHLGRAVRIPLEGIRALVDRQARTADARSA